MLALIRSLWDVRRWLLVLLAFGTLTRATGSPPLAGGVTLTALAAWALWWARRQQAQQVAEGMRKSPLWRLTYDLAREESRRAALSARWGRACAGLNLTARKTTPGLYKLRRTPAGDLVGTISSRSGVPVSKIAAQTGPLAEVVGCREVVVSPTVEGKATIEFRWSDALAQVVLPADLPKAPPGCIPLGRTDAGRSAHLPVLNDDGEAIFTPLLGGGVTGTGKSGLVHAIVAGFQAAQIPVRFRFLDPAGGSELAVYKDQVGQATPGSALFAVHAYSDDPSQVTKMLGAMTEDMRARMRLMAGRRVRLHKPTVEEPFDIFVIDEFSSLPDPLLKKGSALHVLMAQGRKAGFSVIALSQLAEKTNIGDLRELFARRICLGTRTRQQTVAILGDDGDVSALAPAHRIPAGQPGTYYMVSDADRAVVKARIARYTDADVDLIAQGVLPAGMARFAPVVPEPCAVYRLYSWNADRHERELEYIGKALDVDARFRGHAGEARKDPEKAAWWDRVQRFRQMEEGREDGPTPWLQVAWFASEGDALDAEQVAIEAEWPKQNDLHNQGNPLRQRVRRLRAVA